LGSKKFFKNPAVNGWRLYCLICGPMSLAIIVVCLAKNMATPEAVSSLIAYSVRWSIPWLYLAFAASSLHLLFAKHWTHWLVRNRGILGLCVATGMTWQIGFIATLVGWHREFYIGEVYVLRDVIEGLTGYLFLIAMTMTSFKRWRRYLQPRQWKRLHTWGIYFLWAYAFSVYWHELFYYREPDWVDYLYYWGGLVAWSVRLAAWYKRKLPRPAGLHDVFGLKWVPLAAGLILLLVAGIGAVSGGVWEAFAYRHLWDVSQFQWLELYMPYWPFIPYLPLMVAAVGTALLTRGCRLNIATKTRLPTQV
jgi:sulfoxide reductase heme-binding subunit YedZ